LNKDVFHLDNKVVLITGASSGIGRQCAITCSQYGAKVIIIGRNKERLIETFNSLEGKGHLYYLLDITKYDQLEPVIQDAVQKIGPISGFIHSAGIEITKPLKVMNHEDYNNLFSVNVISAFEISRIILKKKYSAENLSLVYISSIMSIIGQPGKVGYCSSKGALLAGTKAMALEYASKNIRVNCVSPAIIETEMVKKLFDTISEESRNEILKMHPMGFGKPKDIAYACIYLLSDASKWITGTNLIVDGGYSAR